MDTLHRAQAMAPDLVELRRDLHRHPELSNREERTARLVAERLERLGLEVHTGVAGTGVVADLVRGTGPTVALRADMDALPIQEASDVPYASTVPGVMHACGHDAHTAALLGAAELLAAEPGDGDGPGGDGAGGSTWEGRLRLLFQPCEETVDEEGRTGAERMVADGALDGVDAALGIHVGAHLEPGVVYLRSGPLFAGSDSFRAVVRGRSAHAARPHEGVDAIVLASQVVTAAQQAVARRLEPGSGGVLGFGTIAGGEAHNVVAEEVRLEGTLRYFRPEERSRLRSGLEAALRTVEPLEGRSSVTYVPGSPPLENDPGVVATLRPALEEALGPGAVAEAEPTAMAEDFALLAREVPAAFLWVGAGLPDRREHHHPRFDIDESCLSVAAATLAAGARALLAHPPGNGGAKKP